MVTVNIDKSLISHLFRRAGFGITENKINLISEKSYENFVNYLNSKNINPPSSEYFEKALDFYNNDYDVGTGYSATDIGESSTFRSVAISQSASNGISGGTYNTKKGGYKYYS